MERSKTAFLETCAGLERVPAGGIARLAARTVSHDLARRDLLWRDGDPVAGLCWVRSGVLREALPHGSFELVLGFRGRGELVGEVGALDGLDRRDATQTGTVTAHEPSVVYILSTSDLAGLLDEPSIGAGLAAACAERARRAEARLGQALFLPVGARIAAALLDLAREFGVRDSRGVIVNLRLTHRDLAALVGASRETASVVLGEWRREGLVAIEGKRVVLLDPPRLGERARADAPFREPAAARAVTPTDRS